MSDIISKIEETDALLKAEGEDILPKKNQGFPKKESKKLSDEKESDDNVTSCVE